MSDEDENPCIGICVISEDGYCEGCGRHEDVIYGTEEQARATQATG